MPVYGYRCEECEERFEIRASFAEKRAGLEPSCPACDARRVKLVVPAGPLIRSGVTASESSSGCAPTVGPGRHLVTAVRVAIVGAPVSCGNEVKDTWRELARWVAAQLRRRYGDSVRVEYHDLFDPECPPLPPDAQLPLVMVNGEVLTSGGELSLPLIRRAIDAPAAMSDSADSSPRPRRHGGDTATIRQRL